MTLQSIRFLDEFHNDLIETGEVKSIKSHQVHDRIETIYELESAPLHIEVDDVLNIAVSYMNIVTRVKVFSIHDNFVTLYRC